MLHSELCGHLPEPGPCVLLRREGRPISDPSFDGRAVIALCNTSANHHHCHHHRTITYYDLQASTPICCEVPGYIR
jgi:hypothetical protein